MQKPQKENAYREGKTVQVDHDDLVNPSKMIPRQVTEVIERDYRKGITKVKKDIKAD